MSVEEVLLLVAALAAAFKLGYMLGRDINRKH